ncbi:sugar phosphate nucleotidyltransferase [Gammaproteobacteria bacterium]|nr:sugar phosphate nucleotidyltransferase [Gammaproteobacteria bacterium]
MKAIIMAGGKGTRLRPFTYVEPKPLLPVGKINPIEYLVKDLKENGVNEIIISINYLKEKFYSPCEEYSKKYQVKIELIEEKSSMGTAGSLSLMKDLIREPFILINGDLFTNPPYKKMISRFNEEKSEILIGIKNLSSMSLYGVVTFNEDNIVERITEKPSYSEWINAGIYIINHNMLNFINKDFMTTPELVSKAMEMGKVVTSYDVGERWLDIGCLEDYEKAEQIINGWKK